MYSDLIFIKKLCVLHKNLDFASGIQGSDELNAEALD